MSMKKLKYGSRTVWLPERTCLKMEIIDADDTVSNLLTRGIDALLRASGREKQRQYKAALKAWQEERGIE